ncbi:hypothetical protein BpHYR1_048164 [Brachionus plicatilis]|uniref:Uncharacterized protein n=1 Tax=Brachionus plicatilis TaxID=10195 RepID=A0A3M7QG10_BRAPC|nr:hypothetical protein BpHYR1_048164 [Brachionus plicatilis]
MSFKLRIVRHIRLLNQNSYFLVPGKMDGTIFLIGKFFIFNSDLIFIRNATYSNIGSYMHIRFHHYYDCLPINRNLTIQWAFKKNARVKIAIKAYEEEMKAKTTMLSKIKEKINGFTIFYFLKLKNFDTCLFVHVCRNQLPHLTAISNIPLNRLYGNSLKNLKMNFYQTNETTGFQFISTY